ncbi:MAG TPA: CBS domain-containing protein [Roseiflexaceae bacterium]|nr:CBS domain-containing protein [Roseiflexaceae bacterium]
MRVRDIMTTEVAAFAPWSTIAQIASAMRDLDIGSVPLVDEGRLVGVLTAHDIVARVVADGLDPNQERADLHMTAEPLVVTPDWTAEQAREAMLAGGVRRLPVVEGDMLVGYLSHSDLAPRERAVGADAPAR